MLASRECCPKKVRGAGTGEASSNKEKTKVVLALKNQYLQQHLLHALQLARNSFYYHAQSNNIADNYQDEKLLIEKIYHDHKGRYGYRRIHLELRKQDVMLNHKTVQRLMGLLGLKSTVSPKRYSSYKGEAGTTAPNVLKRDFNATKPDEKWVTEAVAALANDAKPIVHSDQGWQYRHRKYQETLANSGLTQSMSRKGNCLDNAVAENFFALLKTEMYHNQHFEDADDLIAHIDEYIEYYNTKRIKVKLKGLTPMEYRNQALQAA
ncbi:IS3 family transposase [Vibrio sp. SCSIO 43137]|nr:IS3 family transposase [Vibrio sp. SCSIO 43137]WCE29889.1 IS3 family transposase [Vibrio sp. SCSIO 43137]